MVSTSAVTPWVPIDHFGFGFCLRGLSARLSAASTSNCRQRLSSSREDLAKCCPWECHVCVSVKEQDAGILHKQKEVRIVIS